MRKVTQVVGVTAGALLLLGLGAGIGGAGQKTVTVEKVPAACVAALDLAGQAMSLMSKSEKLTEPALRAAATGDDAGLQSFREQADGLSNDMDNMAPRLGAQVTACRSKQ